MHRKEKKMYELCSGHERYFCRLIDSGFTDNFTPFMVLQKLGNSLFDLLIQRGKTFRIATVAHIGQEMITAMEILHEKGFIH